MEDRITRRDCVDIGKIAKRHHQQIAVGKRCPFRTAGGATGVKKPRWIIGESINQCCGRRRSDAAPSLSGSDNRTLQRRNGTDQCFDISSVFVVANNNSRCAVFKDVPDLVGMKTGVDGDGNETGMPHCKQCFEVLRTIAHHDRHPVTRFDAERVTQTGGRTRCATGELSPGGVQAIAIGKCRLVSQPQAVAGDP